MIIKATLVTFISFMMFVTSLFSQTSGDDQTYVESINTERALLRQLLFDPERTPLSAEQLQSARPAAFFEVDTRFRLTAQFEKARIQEPQMLNMTDGSQKEFVRYGTVKFSLNGKAMQLDVFVNNGLPEFSDNPDQLFIPFSDGTSGNSTAESGRYLTVGAPSERGAIELDFNKAYLSYNGYNKMNVSVLAPQTNVLTVNLAVGQRKFEDR